MRDLIKCPHCGRPLNQERKICEYCGARFTIIEKELGGAKVSRLQITDPAARVLAVEIIISEDMIEALGEAEAVNYAKKEMAQKMAKEIVNKMELRDMPSIERMERRIRGQIRIIEKEFRF